MLVGRTVQQCKFALPEPVQYSSTTKTKRRNGPDSLMELSGSLRVCSHSDGRLVDDFGDFLLAPAGAQTLNLNRWLFLQYLLPVEPLHIFVVP